MAGPSLSGRLPGAARQGDCVTRILYIEKRPRKRGWGMEEAARVLIVDDDPEIRELLVERLAGRGFGAVAVGCGPDMWKALAEERFDLIILDVMIPGEDGLALCRSLRAPGSAFEHLPIIFVTALGETADLVVGLELGADDYLVKPFQTTELVARIRAVLRRIPPPSGPASEPGTNHTAELEEESYWHFDRWRLNPLARHLIDEQEVVVPLSAAEYRLLILFLTHPGRVLNRDQIMECLAGRNAEAYDRSVDVQVSRLRGKLGDNGKNPRIIKTMRGDGYLLAVPVTRKGAVL